MGKKHEEEEDNEQNENESPDVEVVEASQADRAAIEKRNRLGKEVTARFERHLMNKLVEPFVKFSFVDKKRKMEEIMLAIMRKCNEILTYDFTHFSTNLPGAIGADVKISLILFNNEMNCKVIDIWNGILKTTKEVNTNVEVIQIDNRDLHSAYLIAEGNAHVQNTRRRSTINSVENTAKFYGVKNLKQGIEDDKFVFSCGNTGIYLVTNDDPCLKNMSFKLDNIAKWKKSQPMLEELAHRTKNLSKGDGPFIAYEMKDLHGDENWDDMIEYYKIKQAYWTAQPEDRMCYYVFCDGNILLLSLVNERVLFGKCPLTLEDYSDLDDYINFLNETFKDLKFSDKSINKNAAIGVELSHEQVIYQPPEAPPGQFKRHMWKDGDVPDICLPFCIQQVEVPHRSGKNKNCTWVTHQTGRNWKVVDEERRIMNIPAVPDDCKPFAIMINKYIMEDEYAVCAGNETRRERLLQFFKEKADEIVAKDTFLYAISYLDALLRSDVITPEDYAEHFSNISQKVIKKKGAEQQKTQQCTPRRRNEAGPSCSAQ